jgi:hypothetical protein
MENFNAIVLHAKLFGLHQTGSLVFSDGYNHVANFSGEAKSEEAFLEDVFYNTNSIDHGWWENEGIELCGEAKVNGGARSTSVGDVVIVCQGEKETVYRCGIIGWEKIILKHTH